MKPGAPAADFMFMMDARAKSRYPEALVRVSFQGNGGGQVTGVRPTHTKCGRDIRVIIEQKLQKATGSQSLPKVVSDLERACAEEWPECIVNMLVPDIFYRLKEKPHLVLSKSNYSGMSVFHHMLRRPSRDDERMLLLFKSIYEDGLLEEQVRLPALTELKCGNGQTLAFYAAAYGHAQCLKWILEQAGGVERQREYLEICDNQQDTPLHHAVKGGHVGVIELLLDRVPRMLNKPRDDGRTPLFEAFERPEIVKKLLGRGADYSLRCTQGLTPLQAAIDELRWKRQCSRRSSDKAVLRNISRTVRLLKEAEKRRKIGDVSLRRCSKPTKFTTGTQIAQRNQVPCAFPKVSEFSA